MEIDTEKKRWCVTLQKDIEKCPECGGGRYQWRSEDVSLSSQPDLVQGASLGSFFLVVFLPVKQEQKHTFAYLLGVRMNKERVQQSACSNAYLISVTFIRAGFSSNHRRASVSSDGRSGSLACLELRLRNVRIGSLYVVARMLRNDRECPPCVHSQEHDF